jgi:LPXTG-site transpeptidase (sortase) family protein
MKMLMKSIKAVLIITLILVWPNVPPAYAASIVVNTNADNTTAGDGLCTLREAINNANSDSDTTSGDCMAGAGADTISFAGNYTITLAGSQLPVITTTITINGNGATSTIIQANANPNVATNRIFEVANIGNLALNNLTVRNGRCNGTCLTNVSIGGGIYTAGTLTLANTTISANSANSDGGGGIYGSNSAIITITDSTISNNTANCVEGIICGGGGLKGGGSVTITNSTISNNKAICTLSPYPYCDGGGIYNDITTAVVNITNSTISNNLAGSAGGTSQGGRGGGILNGGSTLNITNSTISGNSATDGAGIDNWGTLTLISSNIVSNSAYDWGGGIKNNGPLTVSNSTVSDNYAPSVAGGIFNGYGGTLILTYSTLSNNLSYYGGGMTVFGGTVTVTNSTFSSNSALYSDGAGGGIYTLEGILTVTNSTLSGNSASSGGGIYSTYIGSTTLYNTIVANSPSGLNCIQAGGTITANNFNIDTDGTCDNATQRTSSQVNLRPLADNGGDTQTMALGTGSLAIDVGDPTVCVNSPVNSEDQRGVARPQGAGCDVGAFEYTGNDTALMVISSKPPTNSIRQTVAQITVTYNKAVLSDGSGNAANNTANYLLVEQGANDIFDTQSCLDGRANDDARVTVNNVTYDSGSYTATLNINGGAPLPKGTYRLFVCGTTSVYDLIGLELNGGLRDSQINFTIQSATSSLPSTGFAPNRITSLPAQPAELAYNNLGDIWLEIPSLNVKTEIVGVPQSSNGWDVDWLGQSAGWLNGTAFPSWEGNSVITAHVTDSNGKNGPFANIKNLKHGDKIIVHMYGEKYIFEVRDSNMVTPSSTKSALEHLEGHSYLTLITCQTYNPLSDSYLFRRVVRAVLVETQME